MNVGSIFKIMCRWVYQSREHKNLRTNLNLNWRAAAAVRKYAPNALGLTLHGKSSGCSTISLACPGPSREPICQVSTWRAPERTRTVAIRTKCTKCISLSGPYMIGERPHLPSLSLCPFARAIYVKESAPESN
jgi:hypothetical protein